MSLGKLTVIGKEIQSIRDDILDDLLFLQQEINKTRIGVSGFVDCKNNTTLSYRRIGKSGWQICINGCPFGEADTDELFDVADFKNALLDELISNAEQMLCGIREAIAQFNTVEES